MSIYEGKPQRTAEGGFLVLKDGNPLSPRRSQKVWNHSPDGFNWGYGGSGPAQLALALLLEETDRDNALRLYQSFKWDVVASLPKDQGWKLSSEEIQQWLQKGGYMPKTIQIGLWLPRQSLSDLPQFGITRQFLTRPC